MNWQDTILDSEQRFAIYKEYMRERPKGLEPECDFAYLQKMLKAQAEITWKAREPELAEAHKVGRKEVMDWIQQNQILEEETLPQITGVHVISDVKWQAKLKEWEI